MKCGVLNLLHLSGEAFVESLCDAKGNLRSLKKYLIHFRQLQQRIDQCQERAYSNRCNLLQQQILKLMDDEFRIDIDNQHRLLRSLNAISCEMKDAGDANKMVCLLNYLSSHGSNEKQFTVA